MITGAVEPIRPADLNRLRVVGDARISPDGRRVAFVVTTLSEADDEYCANIWIADTDGGAAPRRFTTSQGRDSLPRWSPDGRRLAFLSKREGDKPAQLYVIPADGGEPTRLTDRKHGVTEFAWSPDGGRLVFAAPVVEEPAEPAKPGKSKPIRVITRLNYRFDGEGFIHDRQSHLFVVPADGGDPRQLTEGDFPHWNPVWSPDGALIAFGSRRHATRDADWIGDIFVMPVEGGAPRQLTDGTGPVVLPVFSPDGRSLAYLGTAQGSDDGCNWRLFRMELDGGKPCCLTADFDRSCALLNTGFIPAPRWAPDGRSILVGVQDGPRASIHRVPAEGGTPTAVVGGERFINAFTLASDGRIAFVATDPLNPPEVFCCGADGAGELAVSDLNREWKAEVRRAPPERFTVTRDGFEIEGWVMKPSGTSAPLPTLLWIHGGPHGVFTHYFMFEFQVYAGAGYAVVYVNPRGSQGYGEAFSRAVVGDWGGGDYADLMAALDEALRRHPDLDAARLGVIGISYGGYMTNWIIGHTTRFRAACAEGSISNTHTHFGASDIGFVWGVGESGGHLPWDDPAWYVQHSPLTYVREMSTPLLLIHAENDLRCPIDQSEQLFVALKLLGRDVLFVRFPDERVTSSRSPGRRGTGSNATA